MHFVDDVDFVAGRGRGVVHAFQNIAADIVDFRLRCAVHFDDIDMAAFGDADTGLAFATRFCCWAALAIRADAIQALGDDPGSGGFTRAANTGHDEGLCDAVCGKCVFERAHHRLLADQIGKGFWPVFPGQDLVGWGGWVGHVSSWDSEFAD